LAFRSSRLLLSAFCNNSQSAKSTVKTIYIIPSSHWGSRLHRHHGRSSPSPENRTSTKFIANAQSVRRKDMQQLLVRTRILLNAFEGNLDDSFNHSGKAIAGMAVQ